MRQRAPLDAERLPALCKAAECLFLLCSLWLLAGCDEPPHVIDYASLLPTECAVKRVLVLSTAGRKGPDLARAASSHIASLCSSQTRVAVELFDDDDAKSIEVLASYKDFAPQLVICFTEFFGEIALAAFEQADIVMTLYEDPVVLGFASSLAKPGMRVTGYTTHRPLIGKRLELLKDTFPNVRSATFISDSFNLGLPGNREEIAAAALNNGVRVDVIKTASLSDILKAIDIAKTDAVYVVTTTQAFDHPGEIASRLRARGLPSVFESTFFVDHGGTLAIDVDNSAYRDRVLQQVQAILRGARASEIPFETPPTTIVAVNLQTLRAFPEANRKIVLRAKHIADGVRSSN